MVKTSRDTVTRRVRKDEGSSFEVDLGTKVSTLTASTYKVNFEINVLRENLLPKIFHFDVLRAELRNEIRIRLKLHNYQDVEVLGDWFIRLFSLW